MHISLDFLASGLFWSGVLAGAIVVGPIIRLLLNAVLPGND
jgi:hypothetical protein